MRIDRTPPGPASPALTAALLLMLLAAAPALAQSSSLYTRQHSGQQRIGQQRLGQQEIGPQRPGQQQFRQRQNDPRQVGQQSARLQRDDERERYRNAALQRTSYTAITPPEPRRFEEQDLVTIIIREQSTATLESTLETEKESTTDGEVTSLPRIRLKDLLEGQLSGTTRGEDRLPDVGVEFNNEFEGEGEYERRDSMTTRLTARVTDVKPNGTLALEARTNIQNDDEQLIIKATGYCRAEDITVDNTVLSTQMFDLRVKKTHAGELRKTSKKGILTRILEGIFNF